MQHQQPSPQAMMIQTTKDGQIFMPLNKGETQIRGPNMSPNTSQPTVQLSTGQQLVLGPRPGQPTQLTMPQGPGGNVIQLVGVNSPSRPTLSGVPVSGTGGTPIFSIHGPGKTQMVGPRVVHLQPNLTLPTNLGIPGARTMLFKTDSGVQMFTIGQQQGPVGPTTNTTIRLQTGTGPQTIALPVGATNSPGATIRTQMPMVVPTSMATSIQQQQQQSHVKISQQGASITTHAVLNSGMISSPVIPTSLTNNGTNNNNNSGCNIPTNTPITVQTSTANSQAASAAPSQMSPTTAKKKCKNFLSTLIRLATDQPEMVAINVKALIQGLVDDSIQPEDFTNQLQKELNSSPQPCLVPFLKKSLPYLRYSLLKEELTIEGVRPPHSSNLTITSAGTAVATGTAHAMAPHTLTQMQHLGPRQQQPPQQQIQQTVRLITPSGQINPNLLSAGMHGTPQILTSLSSGTLGPPLVLSSVAGANMAGQTLLTTNSTLNHHLPNHMSTATNLTPSRMPPPMHQSLPSTHQPQIHHQQSSPMVPISQPPPVRTSTPSKSKSASKSKAKEKAEKKNAVVHMANCTFANSGTTPSFSSTGPTTGTVGPAAPGEKTTSSFRDDDDINDVAAMGGVNLQEESQRILAGNAEIIGQQIRSCKDDPPFLPKTPLHNQINSILKRYGLVDCTQEVVALVSHAAQERLKTMVEKLGVIAEHRQEQLKNNSQYEVLQDVKAQVQFLQELDRIEKKRHEEQEREVLIRAAKSRSKMDDPDHIAIKARAKEMQRLEMEEIRQREANETALQAIGFPKKRMKTSDTIGSLGSNSTLNSGNTLSGGQLSSTSASSVIGAGATNSLFSSYPSKPLKRIKRVTMKDVLFMMEHDKVTIRSHSLYKTYTR